MSDKKKVWGKGFTPNNVYTWSLALYPISILLGLGFLLITNVKITTELAGLLIGLLTAGGLKVAIKSDKDKEEDKDDYYHRNYLDYIRRFVNIELEQNDRRGPDDSDRRFDFHDRVYRRRLFWVPI